LKGREKGWPGGKGGASSERHIRYANRKGQLVNKFGGEWKKRGRTFSSTPGTTGKRGVIVSGSKKKLKNHGMKEIQVRRKGS